MIVEPAENQAYTIFAETTDRSGYARGTLAPSAGLNAAIPKRHPRQILTMKDMGMGMSGMEMGGSRTDSRMPGMDVPPTPKETPKPDNMEMPDMDKTDMSKSEIPGSTPVKHAPGSHGKGNQTAARRSQARLGEPGVGLGEDGWRVLVYTDLKRLTMSEDKREPEREIELHITGNMERLCGRLTAKSIRKPKHRLPSVTASGCASPLSTTR